MDYPRFLHELCDLGPRYAEQEIKAAQLIEAKLRYLNIPFTTQPFQTTVPVCTRAELFADGESIPCQGSSMVSGDIPDAKYVISHFGYSGENLPYNIAYNPLSKSPCSAEHYYVPSVSISRDALAKIFMAQDVHGSVKVEKRGVASENILVGNITNPKKIIFAHFDSVIGKGALDNAGSVVAMMQCVDQNRQFLENNLCIFAGNEELSYDPFCKSYHGFRVFEEKYLQLLTNAEKIIVVDGIGDGNPKISQEWLDWVFYIKSFDKMRNKIYWMSTKDQLRAFSVMHTHDDNEKNVHRKYLIQVVKLLSELLA